MKISVCYANLFYVFGSGYTFEDMYRKGYLGAALIGLLLVLTPIVIFYLHQGLSTLRYFFIMDTITLAMIAAMVAFMGLMSFY
jgi:hypothetical protein